MIGSWLKEQSEAVRAVLKPEMSVVEALVHLSEVKGSEQSAAVMSLDHWLTSQFTERFSKTFGGAAIEIRCAYGAPETARKRVHKGSIVIVHAMEEDGSPHDVSRHFAELASACEEYAKALRKALSGHVN